MGASRFDVAVAERTYPAGPWGKPTLRHLLTETSRFVAVAELVTSRGLINEQRGRRILILARELGLLRMYSDRGTCAWANTFLGRDHNTTLTRSNGRQESTW